MRKIRIKHILKGRDGMTLVEVLAAFAILLMGIAFLYKSTVMSLNQIRKAREVQEQADRAVSEFYEKKAEESSEKRAHRKKTGLRHCCVPMGYGSEGWRSQEQRWIFYLFLRAGRK